MASPLVLTDVPLLYWPLRSSAQVTQSWLVTRS